MVKFTRGVKVLLFTITVLSLALVFLVVRVSAAFTGVIVLQEVTPEARLHSFLTALGSVAISVVCATLALRSVAVAGTALLTERPEAFGAVLLLGGLAEGLAIYGLLVAILILGKV